MATHALPHLGLSPVPLFKHPLGGSAKCLQHGCPLVVSRHLGLPRCTGSPVSQRRTTLEHCAPEGGVGSGGEGRGGEVSWRLKDVDRSQVSREIGTLSLSAFSLNSFSLLDRGEETCCSHGHKACVLHSHSHSSSLTHYNSHSPSLSLSHTHTHTHAHTHTRTRTHSLILGSSFFSMVAPPFPPSVLLLLSLSMAHLLPSEGPLLLLWEVTLCSLHWLGQLRWTGSIQGR